MGAGGGKQAPPVGRRSSFLHYATGTKDAVKELFLEVTKGGSKAESLELDFASQKLFSKWPEKRKTSAIRLLCDAPMLKTLNLSGCGLNDECGKALAEVLANTHTLQELSIERNNIKEAGLTAIFTALETNKTLGKIHLMQQTTQPTSAVEQEACRVLLHGNDTLTKVGMDWRNAQLKRSAEQKLMKNVDMARLARKAAAEKPKNGNGETTPRTRAAKEEAPVRVSLIPAQPWYQKIFCAFCIPAN